MPIDSPERGVEHAGVLEAADLEELRRGLRAADGAERVYSALWIQRHCDARPRLADAAMRVLLDYVVKVLGRDADAQDDAQETLLKLLGALPKARLETPKASAAWLRRVAENVRRDRFRREKSKRMTREHYGQEERVRQQPSPPSGPDPVDAGAGEPDPASALEPHRAALFAHVDVFLEGRQRRVRASGRRNAELAWMRHVANKTRAELARELGSAAKSKDTLSQWIKRGREDVILPSLRAWRAVATEEAGEGEPPELVAIDAMIHFFAEARRSDAGRPRPERRQNVSPDSLGTSVQVEDADVLEQDEPEMHDVGTHE